MIFHHLFVALPMLSHITAALCSEITQQFTTSKGTTYIYDYIPARGANTTVLFLHGFPSTRRDWNHQFHALSSLGYGVIAPDLLGFGDSDRPVSLSAWHTKVLTQDLVALLDSDSITSPIMGVSHDYGSDLLSKMYFYHRDRFAKLAFVSVGYTPAGARPDIDAINAQSLESRGYTQFGYWYMMNSFDAPEVIGNNPKSFYSLLYTPNATSWYTSFSQIGGLRRRLTNGTNIAPPATWTGQEHKDTWLCLFSRPDAIASAINVYRRIMRGTNVADEAGINPLMDSMIKVPVLVLGGSQDSASPGEIAITNTKKFASAGFTGRLLDAGHWLQLEMKEEINSALLAFLKEQ